MKMRMEAVYSLKIGVWIALVWQQFAAFELEAFDFDESVMMLCPSLGCRPPRILFFCGKAAVVRSQLGEKPILFRNCRGIGSVNPFVIRKHKVIPIGQQIILSNEPRIALLVNKLLLLLHLSLHLAAMLKNSIENITGLLV